MIRTEDYLEGLEERIRDDFSEDDVTYKKLNKQKLSKSDFICRFLDFTVTYDVVFNKDVFDTATKEWLKYDNEDYECVKYFLMTSSQEYSLPFSMEDFINMTLDDFVAYQEKCSIICALLDEKRALYEEFNTFYE